MLKTESTCKYPKNFKNVLYFLRFSHENINKANFFSVGHLNQSLPVPVKPWQSGNQVVKLHIYSRRLFGKISYVCYDVNEYIKWQFRKIFALFCKSWIFVAIFRYSLKGLYLFGYGESCSNQSILLCSYSGSGKEDIGFIEWHLIESCQQLLNMIHACSYVLRSWQNVLLILAIFGLHKKHTY